MASTKLNARRALRPQLSAPEGSPGVRRHQTLREDDLRRLPGKLRIPEVFLCNDGPSVGRTPVVTRSQSCRAPARRSRSPPQPKSRDLDSAYSSIHSLEATATRSADSGPEDVKPPPPVVSNRRLAADAVDPKYAGRSEEELQRLLQEATLFEDRRKIRAALRHLRSDGPAPERPVAKLSEAKMAGVIEATQLPATSRATMRLNLGGAQNGVPKGKPGDVLQTTPQGEPSSPEQAPKERSRPKGRESGGTDDIAVLERLLDSTTDLIKRREIRATMRELRRQIREGGLNARPVGSAEKMTVLMSEKELEGAKETTIECQQREENEARNVRSTTRIERTNSQSKVEVSSRTVRSQRRTLGGTEIEELDAQVTRSRVTRKGSNSAEQPLIHPPGGEHRIERDIIFTSDGQSAHSGERFHDEVQAQADLVLTDSSDSDTGDADVTRLELVCPLEDTEVSEGSRLILTCFVRGLRPSAEVTWDCPVSEDRRRHRFFPHTGLVRLEVDGVGPRDAGQFRVTVRQNVQEIVCSAAVTVQRASQEPSFSRLLPREVAIFDDDDLELSCEVLSKLPFDSAWEKDGVTLRNDGKVVRLRTEGSKLSLRIRGAEAACAGNYRVTVRNRAGRIESATEVTVNERPPVELAFAEEPDDVTVKADSEEAREIVLRCVLRESDPTAVAVWFFNSRPVDPRTHPGATDSFDGRTAALRLRNVTPEMSGAYSCGLKNTSYTCICLCRVTVQRPNEPPAFASRLSDQTIRDGDTLVLECQLSARHPKAQVRWFLNSEDICGSEGQRMEFNGICARLVIWDAFEGDCGLYRCLVETPEGSCECTAQVRLEEGKPRVTSPAFEAPLQDVSVEAGDSARLSAKLQKTVPGARLNWTRDGRPLERGTGVETFDGCSASLVIGPLAAGDAARYALRVTSSDGSKTAETSCCVRVQTPAPARPAMSDGIDIETCNDEELLGKMLAKEDNMDKRRKLRMRLKEIREAERKRLEERRKAREQGGGTDSVRTRAQLAEEEKARKLRSFQEQAKIGKDAKTDAVKAMAERAAVDKAERLKHFDEIAKTGGPVAFQGGLEAIKKLDQEASEAEKKRAIAAFDNQQKMQHASSKAEQAVPRVQKTGGVTGVSYGTKAGQKPAARGAMNAFKAMDKASNVDGPKKPNFLSNTGPARGGVTRNPSAIKQMLLEWCKAQVQGYEGVNITNFGSSWADGLAFCALIHHFHPEAFDFSTLNPKNRRANFTLAFDAAEKCADISPLLDVEDMVMMKVPDWKCVFTYVQSFYRKFRAHEKNALRSQEPDQKAKAEE